MGATYSAPSEKKSNVNFTPSPELVALLILGGAGAAYVFINYLNPSAHDYISFIPALNGTNHKLCTSNIDRIVSFMFRECNQAVYSDITEMINKFTLYRFEECSVDFELSNIKPSFGGLAASQTLDLRSWIQCAGPISMGNIFFCASGPGGTHGGGSFPHNNSLIITALNWLLECKFEIGDDCVMNTFSNDLRLAITGSYEAKMDVFVNKHPICDTVTRISHGSFCDKFVINKKYLKFGINVIKITYSPQTSQLQPIEGDQFLNYCIKKFKIVEIESGE
eukprot:122345_1